MDAELRDLISKFQNLQRSESNSKVNDRNVVEIVNVLQKSKKTIDIIFTTDGKEFLTWTQLQTEIINEIAAVGGRMNIVDLATPLNVDMIHIERCIPAVLGAVPNTVMLGGEIIFQTYVNSLVQDAAEILKERGFLLLSDVARSYQLPSSFLMDLLSRAVEESRLLAVFHDAALYTKQFVNAQRMLIRSALLAATKPVNLLTPAFVARCELYAPLIANTAESLIKELPGRIDGSTYVPAKFEQDRDSGIRNVYLSNGFILYSVLSDGGIANPKRYMQTLVNAPGTAEGGESSAKKSGAKEKGSRKTSASASAKSGQDSSSLLLGGAATDEFPDSGFALQRCFLSDRLLRTLFITDFEALQVGDAMLVDLSEKLPAAVDGDADWEIVRLRIESLFPFIVSECTATQQGKVIVSNTVMQRALPVVSAIAVDEVAKNKEKNAVKSKSVSATSAGTHFAMSAAARQKVFGAVITAMQRQVDQGAATAEELLSRWEEPFERCFLEAQAAAAQRVTVESKRLRSEVEGRCAALWAELCILAKGASWSTAQLDDTEAAAAVHKAVLQAMGVSIARLLVVDECLDGNDAAEKAAPLMDLAAPATAQQVRSVVATFDKKRQAPFLAVLDAAQGKSAEGFLDTLGSMNAAGEFKLSMFHSLNRKVERETFASLRTEIMNSASKASFEQPQVATSFAVLVSALVAEKFHVIVTPIPGKAVQAFVARIAKEHAVRGLLESRAVAVRSIRQPDVSITADEAAQLEQLRSEALNKGADHQ
jgi:hypothetical protein